MQSNTMIIGDFIYRQKTKPKKGIEIEINLNERSSPG